LSIAKVLSRLVVEVFRSHTIYIYMHAHAQTHAQSVGLLSTSDQVVAEAATYTTHINKRRTFIPIAGFEPVTPAIERRQTHALDREAIGIGF